MALSVANTVSDIISAQASLQPDASENARLTAMVNALFNRIKADMVVTSQIGAGSITTNGSATTQTGPASPVSVTSTTIA